IGAIPCSVGGHEKIGLPQGHGPHPPADHNNLWSVRRESSFILSFWKVFGTGRPFTPAEPPHSFNSSNDISKLTIICWARNDKTHKTPPRAGSYVSTAKGFSASPGGGGGGPRCVGGGGVGGGLAGRALAVLRKTQKGEWGGPIAGGRGEPLNTP